MTTNSTRLYEVLTESNPVSILFENHTIGKMGRHRALIEPVWGHRKKGSIGMDRSPSLAAVPRHDDRRPLYTRASTPDFFCIIQNPGKLELCVDPKLNSKVSIDARVVRGRNGSAVRDVPNVVVGQNSQRPKALSSQDIVDAFNKTKYDSSGQSLPTSNFYATFAALHVTASPSKPRNQVLQNDSMSTQQRSMRDQQLGPRFFVANLRRRRRHSSSHDQQVIQRTTSKHSPSPGLAMGHTFKLDRQVMLGNEACSSKDRV